MSDLAAFRDHCRAMATSTPTTRLPQQFGSQRVVCMVGDISDADRALWKRLADEIDAYLGHDHEQDQLL